MTKFVKPVAQGLYNPANEHDACGVGFVVHIKGDRSHSIVRQGLEVLDNLTHRGATGFDPLLGDGAGILVQIPDEFFRGLEDLEFELPHIGAYGVGMVFLPQDESARSKIQRLLEECAQAEGQEVLGWRDVPVDNSGLSQTARDVEPVVRQIFVGRGGNCNSVQDFHINQSQHTPRGKKRGSAG